MVWRDFCFLKINVDIVWVKGGKRLINIRRIVFVEKNGIQLVILLVERIPDSWVWGVWDCLVVRMLLWKFALSFQINLMTEFIPCAILRGNGYVKPPVRLLFKSLCLNYRLIPICSLNWFWFLTVWGWSSIWNLCVPVEPISVCQCSHISFL